MKMERQTNRYTDFCNFSMMKIKIIKLKGTRPRTDIYVNEYKNEEELILCSAIIFYFLEQHNLLYS